MSMQSNIQRSGLRALLESGEAHVFFHGNSTSFQLNIDAVGGSNVGLIHGVRWAAEQSLGGSRTRGFVLPYGSDATLGFGAITGSPVSGNVYDPNDVPAGTGNIAEVAINGYRSHNASGALTGNVIGQRAHTNGDLAADFFADRTVKYKVLGLRTSGAPAVRVRHARVPDGGGGPTGTTTTGDISMAGADGIIEVHSDSIPFTSNPSPQIIVLAEAAGWVSGDWFNKHGILLYDDVAPFDSSGIFWDCASAGGSHIEYHLGVSGEASPGSNAQGYNADARAAEEYALRLIHANAVAVNIYFEGHNQNTGMLGAQFVTDHANLIVRNDKLQRDAGFSDVLHLLVSCPRYADTPITPAQETAARNGLFALQASGTAVGSGAWVDVPSSKIAVLDGHRAATLRASKAGTPASDFTEATGFEGAAGGGGLLGDNVHFNWPGAKFLGEAIVEQILAATDIRAGALTRSRPGRGRFRP